MNVSTVQFVVSISIIQQTLNNSKQINHHSYSLRRQVPSASPHTEYICNCVPRPTRLLDVHDQVHAGVNATIDVKCSCRCERSDINASTTDVDIRNGGRVRLFGGDHVAACIPHAVADDMQHLHVINQRQF